MDPANDERTGGIPTDADLARSISDAAPGHAPEAEAELCRRFIPRARLYGLRHLGDPDAAADLAQEALLVTLRRLRSGELREPERIASFVLGTCRMLARDLRRGAGRREHLLEEYGRSLPAFEILEAPRLDHERLRVCLERLAERERSIIVMTFLSGQTSGEVGLGLGLSPENVRVIRHRALGRLRDCMTGEEAP